MNEFIEIAIKGAKDPTPIPCTREAKKHMKKMRGK